MLISQSHLPPPLPLLVPFFPNTLRYPPPSHPLYKAFLSQSLTSHPLLLLTLLFLLLSFRFIHFMSETPSSPSYTSVLKSSCFNDTLPLNLDRSLSNPAPSLDNSPCHPAASTTTCPPGVAGNSHGPSSAPPQLGDPIPTISNVSNSPTPSVNVVAPSLDEFELAQLQSASCLFGKLWGDPIPITTVTYRLKRDWNFIRGEFSLRHLSNGWFLIKFFNPMDKSEVWEKRSWFVQGLNFVLIPWRPFFKPFFSNITHVDQWVKIPFLANEYWTWTHLTTLTHKIGHLISCNNFFFLFDLDLRCTIRAFTIVRLGA